MVWTENHLENLSNFIAGYNIYICIHTCIHTCVYDPPECACCNCEPIKYEAQQKCPVSPISKKAWPARKHQALTLHFSGVSWDFCRPVLLELGLQASCSYWNEDICTWRPWSRPAESQWWLSVWVRRADPSTGHLGLSPSLSACLQLPFHLLKKISDNCLSGDCVPLVVCVYYLRVKTQHLGSCFNLRTEFGSFSDSFIGGILTLWLSELIWLRVCIHFVKI